MRIWYNLPDIMETDSPLVSFCVPFYNQERYVGDTLRGIFAQTYPNVELIACDDRSTDGTADRVEETIAAYRRSGGRIPVTFVRNERNLGIVRNWEKTFSLAHGELLVSCGGDDISYPDRARCLVDAWEKGGRTAAIILHGFDRIGLDGRPSDSDWYSWEISAAHPLGAVTAYVRGVIDRFGPIEDDGGFEDVIFAKRALLLGDELRIDKPLIAYRIGSGDSTSDPDSYRQRLKTVVRCLHSHPQTYLDLEHVGDSVDPARRDRVRALTDECAARYPAEHRYLTTPGFLEKFRAYRAYRKVWGLPNHLSSAIDYVADYLHHRNRPAGGPTSASR